MIGLRSHASVEDKFLNFLDFLIWLLVFEGGEGRFLYLSLLLLNEQWIEYFGIESRIHIPRSIYI